MKNSNQSGFSLIIVVLIVVLFGIIGFTGWYIYNSTKKNNTLAKTSNSQNISQDAKNNNHSSSKQRTFVNSFFKYSFDVPYGYTVAESVWCEGLCVSNLSVNNVTSDISSRDIGVSIVAADRQRPISLQEAIDDQKLYPEMTKQLGEFKIDGKTGTKYYSMGMVGYDTYLFVNNNYYYKITVPDSSDDKSLDNLVSKIIETFKFN
ncbi:MAG: hypothetical protein WCP03_01955 [Candidatus Saccharibacteria bacterium]